MLARHCAATIELFHTATGTAFADLLDRRPPGDLADPQQALPGWLRRRHYEATGEAPSAAAIRSALDLLEARAQFDAPERAVHVRVAEHAGRIYLDLADERWRAVEIGPDGWRVIAIAAGALPPAGRHAAAAGARARRLDRSTRLVAQSAEAATTSCWWSPGCWRRCDQAGPYPLLAISGEQGSAKTVLVEAAQGA